MELYNLPIGVFHYLDCMVLNEMKSEEARQRKEKEMVSDAIEDEVARPTIRKQKR